MDNDIYFKFTAKQEDGVVTEKTIPHSGTPWPELIEEFVQFLRGCGYYIEPGQYEEDEPKPVDLDSRNWDMPHDNSIPFEGNVYHCPDCMTYFWSKWPGHYASCECGNSAVDQTREYIRVIGKAELHKVMPEEESTDEL